MFYILVVDDYATSGMIVKQALTPGKYEVKTVTSGAKALNYIDVAAKIDLILLDINMPDMDGIETLKAIRAKAGFEELPIMFLSGQADKNRVINGFKYGVDDVIAKPVNARILNDRIETVLQGQSPLQLYRKNKKNGNDNKDELKDIYSSLMSDFSRSMEDTAESDIKSGTAQAATGDTGNTTFGIDFSELLNNDKLW